MSKPSGREYFDVSIKKVLKALKRSLDEPGQFIQITSKDAGHLDEGYDDLLSRGMVYRFLGWAEDQNKARLKAIKGEGE